MTGWHSFIIAVLTFCAFSAQAAPNNVNNSGLPIPRFVALKSEEVNIRTGPGTRYPIQWVYRREGLPVEIIEEFEHWRKIRDMEGASGWTHKNMLSGKRTALVKAAEPRVIRSEPATKGRPLLKIEPMVVVQLVECEAKWCRIQVTGRKGWIEKKYLFGVYPDEIFE